MTAIKNKIQNIPTLRFGEFEGEWEISRVGDLFTIKAGGDITKKNVSKIQNEDFKYPIYANAKKNKGLYGYSNIYKSNENVVTIAGRGVYIGIAHARNHKFYPIVRLLVLTPKREADIYFYEHALNRLEIFVESTGVPQLTSPQISSYRLKTPSLPEQKKIATFLSAIDKKISQLTQKVALLEQYKKGVMQQIFSQQIRFKDDDGGAFPDWEEKRLGEVCEKITYGLTIRPKYIEKGIPLISAREIKNGYIDYENAPKISIKNFEKLSNKTKPVKGDLFLSKTGSIGFTAMVEVDFKFAITQNIAIIRIHDTDKYLRYYLLHYMRTTLFIKKALRKVNQSTIMDLQLGDIKKIKIVFPVFQEQKKIANFLSQLDAKINQTQAQLEQQQAYKKGLLQQLFI